MKTTGLLCFFLLFGLQASANGIALSNLTSISGAGFVQLQFDLSWNNSWFSTINHDAAWVFFKVKDNDGTWHHLNLTGANNSVATGYSIIVPPDKTGAIIARSVAGFGTVTLTGVQLGVVNLPGSFDVRGFALEMVEIPLADTFSLGDGAGTYVFQNGSTGKPFVVNANTITMGTTAGTLNAVFSGFSLTNGAFATGFPTGFNTSTAGAAFMMKHEISQAAYRDFLNTLSYVQQQTRTGTPPNSVAGTQAVTGSLVAQRQGVQIAVSGTNATVPAVYGCNLNNNSSFNEADDGEWIGMGNLSWPDVAAYLDWAALRPMTELEFEKACRGSVAPVKDELAAGLTDVASYTYPLSNAGTATESIVYAGSVFKMNMTSAPTSNKPLRVGIHATSNSTRISSGAGYYGALDLSGNISELMVTATVAAGRSFTGINGDGMLTTSGDADEDFWPGINGNTTITAANGAYGSVTGVTGSAGYTTRGGSATNLDYRISQLFVGLSGTSTRFQNQGGRGVKSW